MLNVFNPLLSLAVAIWRDHQEVCSQLGHCDQTDGEEPRVRLCMLTSTLLAMPTDFLFYSNKWERSPFTMSQWKMLNKLTKYCVNSHVKSNFLRLGYKTIDQWNALIKNKRVCTSGTAVPVGEELVPEPVLRDQAICAERPVYSSRRGVGGNGRMKIFVHVSSPHSVFKIPLKCFCIRMATCRLGNLWSDSFYTDRTSSRKNLDIIVKRYFYLSKKKDIHLLWLKTVHISALLCYQCCCRCVQ